MNEIKTDLFPDSLRALKNSRGMQGRETGKVSQPASMKTESGYAGAMKAESGYTDTMTPEEPLPESDRPGRDGAAMA